LKYAFILAHPSLYFKGTEGFKKEKRGIPPRLFCKNPFSPTHFFGPRGKMEKRKTPYGNKRMTLFLK
jgi:hypothetical protein